MTLDELPIGKEAVITKVGGEGALRCRFLDMGLIPKTKVVVQKVAPMGDPIETAYSVDYELTIRKEDAGKDRSRATEETGSMILALVGNQNCGKTTLFNQLTGSNQHVGNFPGVTVDQKMGEVRSAKRDAGCGSAGNLFHASRIPMRRS